MGLHGEVGGEMRKGMGEGGGGEGGENGGCGRR